MSGNPFSETEILGEIEILKEKIKSLKNCLPAKPRGQRVQRSLEERKQQLKEMIERSELRVLVLKAKLQLLNETHQ